MVEASDSVEETPSLALEPSDATARGDAGGDPSHGASEEQGSAAVEQGDDVTDETALSEPTEGVEAESSSRRRAPRNAVLPEQPCAEAPLAQRVEATLLCSDRPLSDSKIALILGLIDSESGGARKGSAAIAAIHAAVEELNAAYSASGRCFRIEAVAGGRQILTLSSFGPLMARIRAARGDGRLSPAALETLAIIAYRQPILRADVESIRGVACGEVLRTLMDRRLVRIVGRAEELGRPMLYGTTREFLRVFGMARIDELPKPGDTGI